MRLSLQQKSHIILLGELVISIQFDKIYWEKVSMEFHFLGFKATYSESKNVKEIYYQDHHVTITNANIQAAAVERLFKCSIAISNASTIESRDNIWRQFSFNLSILLFGFKSKVGRKRNQILDWNRRESNTINTIEKQNRDEKWR